MERLILPRLWDIVGDKITRYQTGFRRGQSTLNNLYRLYSEISSILNSRNPHVSTAFLDLKAAFDRVWHPGLLYKLAKMGIRGKAWLWIKDFLQNRSIRVVHNSSVSDLFSISAGVPQGAVLSPFLFLVYINDLAECAADSGCEIALFADDVAVWARNPSTSAAGDAAVQRFLDLATEWAQQWLVIFGQSKTQTVRFTRKRNLPALPALTLTGFHLADVPHYKYLGVIMQSDLKWDQQVEKVRGSVSRVVGMISRFITPGKPPGFKCVKQMSEALVAPIISYGQPIWRADKNQQASLDKLVAQPIRRCLSLPKGSTPTQPLLCEAGVMNCESIYNLAALRFGHQLLKLDAKDPCKQLLFSHTNTITVEINRVQRSTDVSYESTAEMKAARKTIDKLQFDVWVFDSSTANHLKGIKLNYGTSSYLLHDSRAICNVRARLRFDKASLHASLAQRRIVQDPNCALCHVPETVEHCILHCQRFDNLRTTCKSALLAQNIPFNIATVLGDTTGLSPALTRHLLDTTSSYLLGMHAIRRL